MTQVFMKAMLHEGANLRFNDHSSLWNSVRSNNLYGTSVQRFIFSILRVILSIRRVTYVYTYAVCVQLFLKNEAFLK